ncbi:helix-turn-helix domain-containing protein [Halomarina oriensis]|uniref:Transcriptional regulator n=1 Tax=Halomarina oriensis TaxID=671145 RepID=A0A6B0GLG4_9EURY|nr:helix-turn-helix domain-containing protein [Halomarina oriensis]MWG34721.1 transcriptional regulator [Halomarina oriensis]
MKEFVFALDYDPGCNAIADALAQYPDAQIRSLSCHVTSSSVWRVDHVTGSQAALNAIETVFLDPEHCTDCLATQDCGAECDNTVLDRDEDTLVVYSRWSKARACTSVPHLALDHLGDGLLFETHRSERRYEWRVIAPDDANISEFHDALREELCRCTDIEFVRISGIDPSVTSPPDGTSMSAEQTEALTAAVKHGYYETPRGIELGELAERLEMPRSTLSYRLRRAEAQLATSFVGGDAGFIDAPSESVEVGVRQR